VLRPAPIDAASHAESAFMRWPAGTLEGIAWRAPHPAGRAVPFELIALVSRPVVSESASIGRQRSGSRLRKKPAFVMRWRRFFEPCLAPPGERTGYHPVPGSDGPDGRFTRPRLWMPTW